MKDNQRVFLYLGEELGRYGFGRGHPFNPQRQEVFWNAIRAKNLESHVQICPPVQAPRNMLTYFHTEDYISLVEQRSLTGRGYLDRGDTPAFKGVYEAASYVVGSVVHAVKSVLEKKAQRAFIPIAGLHHARPERAAGFCVFNDLGVAIEVLKRDYGLSRIAYIDIDAHHGDGIYYAFESDPAVIVADIHEDGQFIYPGTGHVHEEGTGLAKGLKLNIPLSPGANDENFRIAWDHVEQHLQTYPPEFILLQGGVDSLAGDPLAHLALSPQSHAFATNRLIQLAEELCNGRLVVTGGGGYHFENIAKGWSQILESLIRQE